MTTDQRALLEKLRMLAAMKLDTLAAARDEAYDLAESAIMLTADTITDAQIETLLKELLLERKDETHSACVIALHDQPTPPHAVRAARVRCAEILNARNLELANNMLRAALVEALDLFEAVWCAEYGHAPKPEQFSRAKELRKLVQP